MKQINNLVEISNNYDVLLCDVWGVLHNGIVSYKSAVKSLKQAKKRGKIIILITNAPRPKYIVKHQLDNLNIIDCYHDILTSGELAINLVEELNMKNIFHIGNFENDLAIYKDLNINLIKLENKNQAEIIFSTGFFDNLLNPQDYKDLFKEFISKNIKFICANPDIVVHIGNNLIYCSGALARLYSDLGGEVINFGKPYESIYNKALKIAEILNKNKIDKSRVLAIGDGLITDVKGANNSDLDVLFIIGGIHREEYIINNKININELEKFLEKNNQKTTYFIRELN